MKLNKTDFDIFDKLFNKIGFGSYYDCIQILRDIIYKIQPKLQCKLEKETDLFNFIYLMRKLTNRLGERPSDATGLIGEFLRDWRWGLAYEILWKRCKCKNYPNQYWDWFEKKWEERAK